MRAERGGLQANERERPRLDPAQPPLRPKETCAKRCEVGERCDVVVVESPHHLGLAKLRYHRFALVPCRARPLIAELRCAYPRPPFVLLHGRRVAEALRDFLMVTRSGQRAAQPSAARAARRLVETWGLPYLVAMKLELPPLACRTRRATFAKWGVISTCWIGLLALACGSSSDDGPASGGASPGGSTSASGGLPSASGGANSAGKSGSENVGSGGSSGQTVDCAAVCGHVKTLCSENNAISDVWLDACKSACDARVQLTPDTAELEQACVMAAADCSAAVNCVATPH